MLQQVSACEFQATCGNCGTAAFRLLYNSSVPPWELHPDTPDNLPLYVCPGTSFQCNGANTFGISGTTGASCEAGPGHSP